MLNIKLLKRLVIISMFIMLIQILLGLKVREFIDLKIDLYGFENKNMWLSNPEINFFIHRSFSIFIFIFVQWPAMASSTELSRTSCIK